jgi:hypothetical protein
VTACSVLGERLGEDLAATAPKAARFLLLEQNGPWTGRNAVTHSDLDVDVARGLLARADEAGLKVHLIRRGSRRATLEQRSCFLVDVARGWVERHVLRDPAEALELDLAMRGERWDHPLYLVCTHGKRDPCCARRGRPLARALRAHRPDETWEIGHIGGHRFAATFLAFPHGLAFGRVPAATGPEIVSALEAGEIALEHLRGRAGDPPVKQAAEVLVRRETGVREVDGLAVEDVDGGTVTLRLRDGARLRATVSQGIDDRPRPLSCADEPETVATYALARLEHLDRAA